MPDTSNIYLNTNWSSTTFNIAGIYYEVEQTTEEHSHDIDRIMFENYVDAIEHANKTNEETCINKYLDSTQKKMAQELVNKYGGIKIISKYGKTSFIPDEKRMWEPVKRE